MWMWFHPPHAPPQKKKQIREVSQQLHNAILNLEKFKITQGNH